MSLLSDIAALRASNATDITAKTAANSITPIIVGGEFDTVCDLLVEVNGLISSAGDLQAVTDLGNTTTDNIQVNGSAFIATDLSDGHLIEVASRKIRFFTDYTPSGDLQFTPAPTANRGWLLPDEGNGTGIGSTIVLHNTKDPILVNDAATRDVAKIAGNYFNCSDPTGNTYQAGPSYSQISSPIVAGDGTILINLSDRLRYKQVAGAGMQTADIVVPSSLSGNWTYSLPNYSGNILTNYGGQNSQALVGASTMIVPFTCPFTPSRVMITPRDAASATAFTGAWVSGITGAHFVISFPSLVTATCTYDYQLLP